MDLHTLGLFVLTETLLSLSPGPAVLLVVGLSMRRGFRLGVMATLGILSTNALYFSLSALGVGALILASATLFTVIKWIGAAYLAYLGLQMIAPLVARWRAAPGEDASAVDLEAAARASKEPGASPRAAFCRGFMLQASNPKILAFFAAILPQFVSPTGDVAGQLVILGIASVLLELPILILYGLLAARSAAYVKARVVDWIEGAAGGILVAMGAALALYRRAD